MGELVVERRGKEGEGEGSGGELGKGLDGSGLVLIT